MKSSDNFCVPLSIEEHRKQHSISEVNYWSSYGGIEKAKSLANALFVRTGDTEEALRLLARFKK